MEIGLAQYVSNKMTLDVPTDAAHLFTVIEQWYWTLGSYRNMTWAPSNVVCIYDHSNGLKYKVQPGQHVIGFDINGQTVGSPEAFFRGLLHIDAIELTPQLTRLWLIPKGGFDDLANGLTAYIREAYGLDTQPAEKSAGDKQGVNTNDQLLPLFISLDRSEVYSSLIALCQSGRNYYNAYSNDQTVEPDSEIVIADNRARQKPGAILNVVANDDGSNRTQFLNESDKGAVVGVVKLVKSVDGTVLVFTSGDVLFHEPVKAAGKNSFEKFYQDVYDHFKAINKLVATDEKRNAQPTLPSAAKPANEKRKGGPIPTPDDIVDAILKEWDEVRGRESQESFCNRKSIGVSTLGAWQRKRKS
jgi:hypothetical protein